MKTKEITLKQKERYIYWLLNESNEPYDELMYLINMLISSDKKETIKETIEIF